MTTPTTTVVCSHPDRHAPYTDQDARCIVCVAVAEAPPLTFEQRAGLAAIWRPAVKRYLESQNGAPVAVSKARAA